MSNVRVTSEIGKLKRVVVHAPGPELLAVTPSNREEYLYDDVIDLERANEEHRRFSSILRQFTEVLYVEELLRQTLEVPEAREFLIQRSIEITQKSALRDELMRWDAAETLTRFIEGWRLPMGPFTHTLGTEPYVLPPLPNLFFTRDSAIVIGEEVVISSMRFKARWPEELLTRTIFGFHPELGHPDILYDGSAERRFDFRVEGGDVHPLSETAVLVGLSERTSAAALDELTAALFEKSEVSDVIAVVLPERTTAIHLDMVWTMVDRNLAVAHAPMFDGPRKVPILHVKQGREGTIEHPTVFAALAAVGMKVEPIWCGGETPESREREQWSSGCNFFSVAPGKTISYARNEGTLRNLERAGFRIIEGERLLLGDERVKDDDKAVITFLGSELVRGGGGPRCMTCPIERDPVD